MCSVLSDVNLCAQHPLIRSRRKHDDNEANLHEKCTMKWGTCTSEAYCCCWWMFKLEWFNHNESQLAKVALIEIQQCHAGLDCRSQLCLNVNHRPERTQQWKLQLRHEYPSRVSVWCAGLHIWGVPEWLWYTCIRCGFATIKWAHGSYSDTRTQ